ncbi:MAG: signal recognition particle protein [Lachnospiraceae bacterium]|nr:signal recognition particle protein [Lachnospiraceae bacterium]MBR6150719.1 signal recognition particle protein [Lachnospiraceae bacterium]
MAFESLTDKLQNIFKSLRGKGKLSEEDVKVALKEVKMALLEADVNFKVVKQFVKSVEERAIGQDVMNGLNPGQMVIKIVNEEMISLMGSETTEVQFQPGKAITVVMMAGLQGAGKTTATAKLAGKFRQKGKKCLLVACDVYRPAAVEQLHVNGDKIGIDVFDMGTNVKPVEIAKEAIKYAEKNGHNVVILDTAGRLHVDEDMMAELQEIKENVTVHQTLLVVDAMTGQDAVNVASEFNQKVGVDGVILSKMDGDTRGGAALSIKAVTGKPILYVSMGEKLTDMEQFYPDRMANRILGMGDVLTLIEKAQEAIDIDEDKGRQMADHMKKGKFDFEDYLESMKQMRNMGGLASILGMLPGMGVKASELEGMVDEKQLKQMEAIVLSMTIKERRNPKLLNPQRKHRIAKGAGVDIAVVNRFIKQFEQSQKMMKQFGSMGGKRKGGFGGLGGFGGMGGFPGKGGRFPF